MCVKISLDVIKNTTMWNVESDNCCGVSVASEQQHKQDLRRIYKRENEFSKSSLFTRMLCGFLPECIAPSTNALPRTTRGCDTVVTASFFCVDCS